MAASVASCPITESYGDTLSKELPFNGKKETIIIAHGFLSNPNRVGSPIVEAYTNNKKDYNFILIDWSEMADGRGIDIALQYQQAKKNALEVGKASAKFLSGLKKTHKLRAEKIHGIGHSLGAHLMGSFGRHFPSSIGRITGLDPAGPGFKDAKDRLRKSDAKFVDVIHTSMGDGYPDILEGEFGFSGRMGHVDFYPNGGENQPGCALRRTLKEIFSCAHNRAIKLFVDSVGKKSPYMAGTLCDSWKDFQNDKCKSKKNVMMGEAAEESFKKAHASSGAYFLETNSKSPYGKSNAR